MKQLLFRLALAMPVVGAGAEVSAQSFTHSWSTFFANGRNHNAVTVFNTGWQNINCNVVIFYTTFGGRTSFQQSMNTHTGLIAPGGARQTGGIAAPVSNYSVRCWPQ